MDNTNRIYVERALDLMVEGLLDPFDELMNKHYGVAENWTEAWAKGERDRRSKRLDPGQRPPKLKTYSKTDPQFQMRVILETFQIFKRAGYSSIIISHAGEIKDKVRNPSAHRSSFFSDEEAQRALETIALLLTEFGAHDQADAVRALRDDRKRVVVGSPVGVGTVYQPRQSDDKISELFSDSGDRRLWLRGGQGFGKSFAARKVVEDALATSGDEREDVVIWVDSANPRSVIAALSSVVDRMPELKIDVALDDPDRAEKQARALLEVLATCRWRWLIVFDNADAGALIEQKLIPVGTNPNGRLLVTTLSHDQRIPTWGRIVNLEVFTPREADDFITSRLNPQTGEVSFLADVDETQRIDLAKALGYHPLALSIATATIITHNLSIPLWLSELQTGKLDQAADVEDPGGYPLLVGASFRAALNRAAIDVPLSVLERAAAAVAFFSNDGVPTWIFDLPEFRSWIFGDEEIATRHGKPYVFQSLLNHGLIQLDSNTWDVASITMHQLVARAMVENFTTDDFLELVEALISFDNSDMEIEIMERAYETWPQTARVITGLSHNPEVTKDPRLKYLLSSSNEFYYDEYSKSNDRLPFPVIDNYQDFPQERWLGQALLKQGDQQKTLGQHDQAEESWTQALDVFQKCSELDPEKQLLILREIGYLQNKLGYEQKASDSYRSALEISENLPQTLNLVARVRRSIDRAKLLRTLGMQEEALTESESGLQLASETPPETPIMKKLISARLNASFIFSLFEVHGRVGAMELPRYFEMRTQLFADQRGLNRLYEKGHPSPLLMDLVMIDAERMVLEPRDSNEDMLGLMKEKLAEISELRANDPTNIMLIKFHAIAAEQYGSALRKNGDLSEAAEFHSLAIELFKTVFDLTPVKHASRAEIQQRIQDIIYFNSDSSEPHERLEIAKDQFKTVEKLIREDPNNPDRQSLLLMPLILLMKGLEHSDPEKEKYAQRSIELLRFLTVFEITHSASSLALELSLAESILGFHFVRQELEEVVARGREWDLILFGPSGFGVSETDRMSCCMLIGLASFSVDDFELAVKYFEAAADRAAIQDYPDVLKVAVEGLLLCYDRIGQAEKVEEIKNKYPEILGPDGMHLDDD